MAKPLQWTTVQRKVNDLVPLDINPRKISEAKRMKMIESLQKFNLVDIPTVDFDNTIISGHQRLRAMQAIGRGDEMIDVRFPNRKVTPTELKELNLLANTHFGEWDEDVFEEYFSDVDVTALGFSTDDFKLPDFNAVAPAEKQIKVEVEEDEYQVPDEILTDIVEGDLFEIGSHKLLCGDSTQVDTWKKLFGDKMADLVMTDPPYNVDYEGAKGMKIMNDNQSDASFYQFLYDFFVALGSFTKKGGAWYVWHADSEGLNFRKAFTDSGLTVKQCLIWVKNSFVMGWQDYQWKHEPCLYGWQEGAAHFFTDLRTETTVIDDMLNFKNLKKEDLLKLVQQFINGESPSTILRYNKPVKNDLHPTMKPVPLIADLIQNSSRRGEIVADGFLGSGSTMVASHKTGRLSYGIELAPHWCQVIIDRMLKLDPTLEIKRNGQPYEPKR